MAYTATRGDLRDAARRRCDQVNSTFRADADVNALLNSVIAEAYEHVIINQPERKLASVTLITEAGVDTYGLGAADFYKLKDVDARLDNRWRTLPQFKWEDRNRYRDSFIWTYSLPAAWRLYGDNIVFTPPPPAGVQIRLWYHPAPPKLSDDSDTFDGVAGWDEAVVVGVAWKLALEEEDLELADRLGVEYQRQLQRILDFGAVRVTEHVEYARDVYKPDGDDW